MLKKTKKNKKGFALVMTLMILSFAMLTGLFMNGIIVGELRVSLNTINVVNSYYAAESGIEKALYYITTDKLADSAIDNVTYYDSLDASSNSYSLSNDAQYSYTLTSISAPNFSTTNVNNTNPAHVSIIDPLGNVSSINWSVNPDISGVVKWRINNCFPSVDYPDSHASDRLEITQYSFADSFTAPAVYKIVAVCDCSSDPQFLNSCRNVKLTSISGSKYYHFIFRPLDSPVSVLDFSLENAPGILSETLTKVKGKYKNSEYLLQAKMSALRPTSDIFSYVIFSEEDLTKDQ